MTVTYEQIKEAVEDSTVKMTVCVPQTGHYRSGGGWEEEQLEFIDPSKFLYILEMLARSAK